MCVCVCVCVCVRVLPSPPHSWLGFVGGLLVPPVFGASGRGAGVFCRAGWCRAPCVLFGVVRALRVCGTRRPDSHQKCGKPSRNRFLAPWAKEFVWWALWKKLTAGTRMERMGGKPCPLDHGVEDHGHVFRHCYFSSFMFDAVRRAFGLVVVEGRGGGGAESVDVSLSSGLSDHDPGFNFVVGFKGTIRAAMRIQVSKAGASFGSVYRGVPCGIGAVEGVTGQVLLTGGSTAISGTPKQLVGEQGYAEHVPSTAGGSYNGVSAQASG